MKTLLFLTLLFLSFNANAENTFLRDTATALIIADWMQTRDIARYPHDEKGEGTLRKIIGKNPSAYSVNWFFSAKIFGHYMLNKKLSKKNKKYYNLLSILLGINSVIKNKRVGLSIKF